MEEKIMNRKNVLIFDFDGTLADTTTLVKSTLVNTIHEYGYPEITMENIEEHFGPTEAGILKNILGDKIFPEAWASYLEDYIRVQPECIKKIPGMDELLKELSKKRDILLLLVTGRSKETMDLSLSYLNYESYFSKCYSGSMNGINKDENILQALEDYGLEKENIVYIGDTLADIHTMRKIGVDILSVNYCGFDKEGKELLEKENPGNVCTDIDELKKKIEEITL